MSELEDFLAGHLRLLRHIPKPERETRFHPTRKWRLDFFWPDHKFAVEVEGGSWVGGAHNRGVHFEQDCEKYAEAMLAGIRVLRVTGRMIEDGRAVAFIERALGVAAG